jgi:hypothetical protein
MPDRNTQHGSRLDEAMEAEVEGLVRGAPIDTRARDDLGTEPLDDDATPLPDPEDELHHREVLGRSDLARFLRPSAFPADADTLLDIAREEHAPAEVLAEIDALARGRDYVTVGEVWAALGHEPEHRDPAPAPPNPSGKAADEEAADDIVTHTAATPAGMPPPVPEPAERSLLETARDVTIETVARVGHVLLEIPRRVLRR